MFKLNVSNFLPSPCTTKYRALNDRTSIFSFHLYQSPPTSSEPPPPLSSLPPFLPATIHMPDSRRPPPYLPLLNLYLSTPIQTLITITPLLKHCSFLVYLYRYLYTPAVAPTSSTAKTVYVAYLSSPLLPSKNNWNLGEKASSDR